MKFTFHQSKIKALRQSDDNFYIKDKFVTTPRAGFEISQRCPENYRDLLLECIGHGWIKPVAHVTDYELLLMTLGKK